jgi:LEA14-like dessication related protein
LQEQKVKSRARLIRIHALGLAMISLCFLGGCAGLGRGLESPRVHIADIQAKEVRPLEAVFQVELRVLNTNEIPITVRGVDCELEINDKHFASGVASATTEIPAYGTATVPITVYSSVLDVVRGVLGLQKEETLRYRLKGRLRIEGGYLAPSFIRFDSAGELDLKRLREPR